MAANLCSLPCQKLYLESFYEDCIKDIKIERNKLTCIMFLRPSPESVLYEIKIECKQSGYPRVWLLSPELQKVDGKRPHHIFSSKNENQVPELCIYDSRKGYNELQNDRLWARTLIPWIISWLDTYEYWVITGKWHHAEILGGKRLD